MRLNSCKKKKQQPWLNKNYKVNYKVKLMPVYVLQNITLMLIICFLPYI